MALEDPSYQLTWLGAKRRQGCLTKLHLYTRFPPGHVCSVVHLGRYFERRGLPHDGWTAEEIKRVQHYINDTWHPDMYAFVRSTLGTEEACMAHVAVIKTHLTLNHWCTLLLTHGPMHVRHQLPIHTLRMSCELDYEGETVNFELQEMDTNLYESNGHKPVKAAYADTSKRYASQYAEVSASLGNRLCFVQHEKVDKAYSAIARGEVCTEHITADGVHIRVPSAELAPDHDPDAATLPLTFGPVSRQQKSHKTCETRVSIAVRPEMVIISQSTRLCALKNACPVEYSFRVCGFTGARLPGIKAMG
jgi:hypothetical protein